MRVALLAVSALCFLTLPAAAEDRETLGWGRLFSNDTIGDGQDRWRTGSYALSRISGDSWNGALPGGFGEILELRLRADTIAPSNLDNPAADDRRYAGLVTIGLHTHLAFGGFEASVGGGIALTGPQTGVGTFQSVVHGAFGLGDVNALDTQLENAVYLTAATEMGRRFAISDRVEFRPFIAAEAGVETLVRAGGDLVIGDFGRDDLMLRDTTTGQRFRGVEGEQVSGLSFTLGGDIAKVFDSVLLPDGGAVDLVEDRSRLRAGVHWQGGQASVFYGLTYLSKEFEQQDEGQILGSLNVNLWF
ncbi:MAG: lipid A-modifier LpxR family protein [Paracoccaceae bacterium]